MNIYDLTRPFDSAMPVWPGDPALEISVEKYVLRDGYRLRKITFGTHFSTHFDAPAHVLSTGKFLDDFPIEIFFGRTWLADLGTLPPRTRISAEMLEPFAEHFRPGARILLRTGWDFGKDGDYFRDAPFLSEQAAEWVADRKIAILGLDFASPDAFDDENVPSHRALARGNVLILENLWNLSQLPTSKPFRLTAFPLSLTRTEAAPVRVTAHVS